MKQIYGPKVGKPGHLPYRIFSNGQGETYGFKDVQHWPGIAGQRSEVMPTDSKMWGFMGLAVEDYHKPIAQQKSRVAWYGIDVDGKDNVYEPQQLAYICAELFNNDAIIRYSKSGNGVHIIFPCDKTGLSYEEAKQWAKQACIPHLKRLVDSGICPCVYGLVNMWLYSEGGKQKTLHVPERFKS